MHPECCRSKRVGTWQRLRDGRLTPRHSAETSNLEGYTRAHAHAHFRSARARTLKHVSNLAARPQADVRIRRLHVQHLHRQRVPTTCTS
jgi:hypothetical protein